ncbi:MAG TPA: DUF4350 domain-containing protein [bacterium]|nr:DUF4350 domain-containing protein [bacterium]HPN33008.1 DUF4350 domain-containing protein [bacterium]
MSPLKKVWFAILLGSLAILSEQAAARVIPGKANRHKVVGLDNYYNREFHQVEGCPPQPFHYLWEDARDSGFSGLAAVIQGLGAQIAKVTQAPDASSLEKLSIYIIVDPDTPEETDSPNFIAEQDITLIADWVAGGGVLMLLANDKDHCELQHLNRLAETFGIHFNEDLRNTVIRDNYTTGRFTVFPAHPLFIGVDQIFLKEICTLRLQLPAVAILQDGQDVVMALSKYGQGYVYAVGDPWLYNEYLDGYKLPPQYENTKAANNLFLWLLDLAREPKQ